MHDIKERLSVLWIFVLLNYLYADVVALFAIVGSQDPAPHLTPWALLGSAVLMEIPIAMIVASRLLPLRANRLANLIAGAILTLINAFLTFVLPLANGDWHEHMFLPYMFFGTIETVCTLVIIWQAWTWSGVEAAVSSERIAHQPEAAITSAWVSCAVGRAEFSEYPWLMGSFSAISFGVRNFVSLVAKLLKVARSVFVERNSNSGCSIKRTLGAHPRPTRRDLGPELSQGSSAAWNALLAHLTRK
jgi:Family of unknown function (DUF6326)